MSLCQCVTCYNVVCMSVGVSKIRCMFMCVCVCSGRQRWGGFHEPQPIHQLVTCIHRCVLTH